MRLESKNRNAARPSPIKRIVASAWVCAFLSAGCTPTYNWRTVSLADLPVQLQLPCKPDQTTQTVPMGKGRVDLHAVGCEQAGIHWSVMGARLGPDDDAEQVLLQWQALSMQHMQAQTNKMDDPPTDKGSRAQEKPDRSRSAVFLAGADPKKRLAHVSWQVLEVAQVRYVVQAMAMYESHENKNTALREARTNFHDSIRERARP